MSRTTEKARSGTRPAAALGGTLDAGPGGESGFAVVARLPFSGDRSSR
ncbi:hypothetical protein [Streptomyces acidiscabies]|nr:hypothetical protein [Streptomyces acidiscabies]